MSGGRAVDAGSNGGGDEADMMSPEPVTDPSDPLDEGIGHSELQRRAVAGSFWTAVHTLVSVPLAFVVNAVVARVLGPAEYGGLAFLTLALALAVQVTNAGVSDATVQWGAGAAARGARQEVSELLARSLGFHVAVQLPFLVATVVILAESDGLVAAVIVAAVVIPAFLSSSALLITIESRTAAGAKLAMVSNLVVQGGVVVAALTTESPPWVWAVRVLAGTLLLPLNFLLLDRWGRRTAVRFASPLRRPPGFWRFALLTMVGGLISMLVFSRSEILFLNAFGDATAVGLFALAFGVAAQLTAPVDALLAPLIPAVAGLMSAHPEQVRRGRERALRASSFLSGGLLAVAVPALYCVLPTVYGAGYSEAQVPFFVLAATSCLQSVCAPLTTFLSARRQAGLLLRIYAVAFVADAVLAVALIPRWGLDGALIANVSAQVVVLGLLVRAEAGFEHERAVQLVKPMRAWVVGLVAAVVAAWGASWTELAVLPACIVSLALGLLVYVLGLRLARAGMADSDWAALTVALPGRIRPLVRVSARVFGADPGAGESGRS
jgi:O-antigen/teichoic acid export membrane protein